MPKDKNIKCDCLQPTCEYCGQGREIELEMFKPKITRVIIDGDIDPILLYDKLEEMSIPFIKTTIQYISFKEYMDAVYERNKFETPEDPFGNFGYPEQFLKDSIYEIHDYYEGGLSPYKVLTFLGCDSYKNWKNE